MRRVVFLCSLASASSLVQLGGCGAAGRRIVARPRPIFEPRSHDVVAKAKPEDQSEELTKLTKKALQQRLTAQGACEVEGFIPPEAVRAHMAAASFILGKPGPGVVSEAAAAGTPFVTERRYAMPQERPVLEWIGEAQTGVVVDSLTKLPNDLLGRVEACRAAIDAHMAARPAVWIVADAVRSLLEAGPDRTAVP